MKIAAILLITASLFSLSWFAANPGESEIEKAAIKEAAMNYLEGWYQGSPERMEKPSIRIWPSGGCSLFPTAGTRSTR